MGINASASLEQGPARTKWCSLLLPMEHVGVSLYEDHVIRDTFMG